MTSRGIDDRNVIALKTRNIDSNLKTITGYPEDVQSTYTGLDYPLLIEYATFTISGLPVVTLVVGNFFIQFES